ncbi:MAG: cytochrome c5 family protein [Rhodocyclaceae bacterium]|nr:cytochrome c5 family protein [Rhodocyclaceae bacterium]
MGWSKARQRWAWRRWALAGLGVALLGGMGLLGLAPPGVEAAASSDLGRETYVQTCALCHAKGTANAPRVGHREEWAPRVARGREELLRSVLRGRGAMPPKGGNASLSDKQAAAALDYLLSQVQEAAR